ncbi:MAG TPA: 4Fe-4S dicluster domain-containing protein [Candidatus Omnitrophota bacterium]|nr:4Fe-4S dicluster domain-containing protein [Candidatus Omnitrophota bacterium]
MGTKKIFCDITKCVGCKTCELACAVEHAVTKDLFLAVLEYPKPIKRIDSQFIERDVFHSIGCQHCDDPPCIEACMAGCISKDKKTGKVDIDIERCVGCWMCIMVCPFAAISRQYTKENKALKCDLCPQRDNPSCVDYCPTKALSFKTRKPR